MLVLSPSPTAPLPSLFLSQMSLPSTSLVLLTLPQCLLLEEPNLQACQFSLADPLQLKDKVQTHSFGLCASKAVPSFLHPASSTHPSGEIFLTKSSLWYPDSHVPSKPSVLPILCRLACGDRQNLELTWAKGPLTHHSGVNTTAIICLNLPGVVYILSNKDGIVDFKLEVSYANQN